MTVFFQHSVTVSSSFQNFSWEICSHESLFPYMNHFSLDTLRIFSFVFKLLEFDYDMFGHGFLLNMSYLLFAKLLESVCLSFANLGPFKKPFLLIFPFPTFSSPSTTLLSQIRPFCNFPQVFFFHIYIFCLFRVHNLY